MDLHQVYTPLRADAVTVRLTDRVALPTTLLAVQVYTQPDPMTEFNKGSCAIKPIGSRPLVAGGWVAGC